MTFTQNKGKKCFKQPVTFAIFTVNASGTVPQIEAILQTGKVQTGKKFIEMYIGCKELQGFLT